MMVACNNQEQTIKFSVENTLNAKRSFETITLTKKQLGTSDLATIAIRNMKSNEWEVSQAVDNDGDGVFDELLFQPALGPHDKVVFEVIPKAESNAEEKINYCYSRFVPERTDDYAWENDRVAFRMFGPTAQQMKEDNIQGGTLTSGVDLWLKRVDYPIINKWYKKTTEGTGSYHEDTGEGVDNFHVGVSRGVGGVAIKKDSLYYVSKNFTKWKTITTGPIRTSFTLEYEDWNAGDVLIKETKTISLDYGNNLSKFETDLKGSDVVSVGLTLHEKDGSVTHDSENGWVSYWQPHGDSELGTAIVASQDQFIDAEEYITDERDLSHAYANLNVENNKLVYYAGFGWKKSDQFKSQKEWEAYLNDFVLKMRTPIKVTRI
jgi:hypothetical protein